MMCLFALRELNAFTSVTSVVIFLTSLDGFGCCLTRRRKPVEQGERLFTELALRQMRRGAGRGLLGLLRPSSSVSGGGASKMRVET